ncbi:MAG: response regulator [Candidatus Tectomicrobia bacterium]|nr:response regulator [Candidatus Tectomicrobia bacterium]
MGKHHLIVVVDDLFFLSKIESTLRAMGLKHQVIREEAQLFLKAPEIRPSMIILDLHLKTSDPMKVIAHLKGDKQLKMIPILAYASHVDQKRIKEAQDIGCDEVVARSVFSEQLPQLIQKHLPNW